MRILNGQVPLAHHGIGHVHLDVGEDAGEALDARLVAGRAVVDGRAHRVEEEARVEHDAHVGQVRRRVVVGRPGCCARRARR